MDINVHNTKKITITNLYKSGETLWRVITITEKNGSRTEITLFGKNASELNVTVVEDEWSE